MEAIHRLNCHLCGYLIVKGNKPCGTYTKEKKVKVSGWEGDEQEISTPGAYKKTFPWERKGGKTACVATKYIVVDHHHHSVRVNEWSLWK